MEQSGVGNGTIGVERGHVRGRRTDRRLVEHPGLDLIEERSLRGFGRLWFAKTATPAEVRR